MNRIVARRQLAPEIVWFEVEAPRIARRWKPGQFLIVRPNPDSERIPLTIVDGDERRGTIVIVVQAVGKTTKVTNSKQPGECFADVVGPLGEPAHIERAGHVACVGGGVGVAELLPVARALRQAGNRVTALCGARSAAYMILDEELRAAADEVLWATDDGSAGFHGTVVGLLLRWREQCARPPDLLHIIGPVGMMRAAAEATRSWGVRAYASLNPIMIDGTGMCGGCRVTVGGKVRFACVEGPEFDAYQVDFEELALRLGAYRAQERLALDRHQCQLGLHL